MECEICNSTSNYVNSNGREWIQVDIYGKKTKSYHKSCYDKSILQKFEVPNTLIGRLIPTDNKMIELEDYVAPQAEVVPQERKGTTCPICALTTDERGSYTKDKEGFIYHNDCYIRCFGAKPTEPEEKKEEWVEDYDDETRTTILYKKEPEESEVEVIEELGDTYIGCQDGIDLWEVGKLEDKINELVRTVNRLAKEIKLKSK